MLWQIFLLEISTVRFSINLLSPALYPPVKSHFCFLPLIPLNWFVMKGLTDGDGEYSDFLGLDDKRRLPQLNDVVDVWWDDRDLTFRGKLGVAAGCASPRSPRKPRRQFRFTVYYDDGDVFVHDLNRMTWRFVDVSRKASGKWIQPGELETRSVRAFKALQNSHHSESNSSSNRSASKRNRPLSIELLGHSQPCVKAQMTDRKMSPRERNGSERCNGDAKSSDQSDVDMKENENDTESKKKGDVKDDEKYVLEALLLLSDNTNLGLIPSSPVPYRKRHHVRYISSISTH